MRYPDATGSYAAHASHIATDRWNRFRAWTGGFGSERRIAPSAASSQRRATLQTFCSGPGAHPECWADGDSAAGDSAAAVCPGVGCAEGVCSHGRVAARAPPTATTRTTATDSAATRIRDARPGGSFALMPSPRSELNARSVARVPVGEFRDLPATNAKA